MPYIVMVGLTSDGKVYYADMDVPIQPKWIETTLTGISDIAGSYGKLFTIKTGGSVPKYGPYDSATQTLMNGMNTLTQITVDDINAVAGVNGTSLMYASSFTSNFSNPSSSTAKWVSMSAGIGYSVGSDGKLYYSASPATGIWKRIDAANDWKQVCIDGGVVCAIKNNGTLWYIDKNIGFLTTGETITSGANSITSAANITQSALPSGVTFTYISLKAGRLVGLGNNGNLYYSDSYSNPAWKTVSTQPYNSTTGVASGSAVSFSKVILMHPRMDARRKRFLGSAKSCNSNEQQIGNFCYQPCPSGRDAIGASCPYLAKYVKGIESCPTGTQNINGGCFQACPDRYTADGDLCKGYTTDKLSTSFSTNASPTTYRCSTNGSVPGRYIRVRPTTLINNNKLCITSLIVKDSNGTVLSTRSTDSGTKGVTKATDGTCIDAPVGGTTCPTVGGVPPAYLSGNTYNSDKDSGNISRSNNLYWEVDLGSIQNIKTIEFIGCTYQKDSTSGATTSVTGTTNAVQDQIRGMRFEVLYNENSINTPPIASRTLGSSTRQTITFDYTRQVPPTTGDRCYDLCPQINGVDSMDQGSNSCVASSGTITTRAITVPLTLADPVSVSSLNSDGTPYNHATVTNTGATAPIPIFTPSKQCLNRDGRINPKAILYNEKCIMCSSPKDTFYPRGVSNNISWSDEQVGTITQSSTDPNTGEVTTIDSTRFDTIIDAKNSCETYINCKGITKYIDDALGYVYYTMGTSTIQSSLSHNKNKCWTKNVGSRAKPRRGDFAGQEFSSNPIPRAFADDYTISNPSNLPTNSQVTTIPSATGTQSLIDYLANAIQQACMKLLYQYNIEKSNIYYTISGIERRIKANISTSSDYGICVGPCDPEHPLSDPIQMTYNTYESPPLYILYGTMCYDSSEIVIEKPNIPAIVTPGTGNKCPDGYFDTGLDCLQHCPYGSKDNGSSCTIPSIPRLFIPPSYSCPDPKMPLVGSVCLLPCEGTDLLVGEYCEPSANTLTLGSNSGSTAINCTRTTYSYSSKYKSSPSNVGKWLCDSDDDLNSLLAGYLPDSGATYYVNENDIVCVADDPTTGMYYCQSVKEAVNQTQDTTRDDNNTVCNKLVSAYQDLSNNIDIISSAKTNAQNANLQVVNIQITLQGVYNSICPAANSGTPMCTTLQSQLTALGQNINAGSSANSNILNPIQVAMSSRDNLVAQMTKFQCEY